MTEQTPNAALAYQVLDHIDAHPEQWNQFTWWKQTECGTAGCFAGWAVALGGGQLELRGIGATAQAVAPDGQRGSVATEALRLLGIEYEDYACDGSENCGPCNRVCSDPSCCGATAEHQLFSASNTRADLQRGVEAIFGPRPEPAPTEQVRHA